MSDSKPTLIKTLFDNGLAETPTIGETLSWELMSNYDRVSIVSYLHISNTKGSYKSSIITLNFLIQNKITLNTFKSQFLM